MLHDATIYKYIRQIKSENDKPNVSRIIPIGNWDGYSIQDKTNNLSYYGLYYDVDTDQITVAVSMNTLNMLSSSDSHVQLVQDTDYVPPKDYIKMLQMCLQKQRIHLYGEWSSEARQAIMVLITNIIKEFESNIPSTISEVMKVNSVKQSNWCHNPAWQTVN